MCVAVRKLGLMLAEATWLHAAASCVLPWAEHVRRQAACLTLPAFFCAAGHGGRNAGALGASAGHLQGACMLLVLAPVVLASTFTRTRTPCLLMVLRVHAHARLQVYKAKDRTKLFYMDHWFRLLEDTNMLGVHTGEAPCCGPQGREGVKCPRPAAPWVRQQCTGNEHARALTARLARPNSQASTSKQPSTCLR